MVEYQVCILFLQKNDWYVGISVLQTQLCILIQGLDQDQDLEMVVAQEVEAEIEGEETEVEAGVTTERDQGHVLKASLEADLGKFDILVTVKFSFIGTLIEYFTKQE